jgi:serine phosphatase RsbU (regulator of sigma subunit)
MLGVLFSLLVAAVTQRLVQRRRLAEAFASVNRQLYREQRHVAETLQLAFLPKALPEAPSLDLAARYIPSTKGMEIGGDWYSTIPIDSQRLAFVVGDVSGHGIDAATVMAPLGFTIRALAKLNYPISQILDRANEEIDLAIDDHFATAVVGVVDTRRRELTLASAGHLPPLLLRGDDCGYVDLPIGLPLGVGARRFETRTVPFDPGSTLVAFTDGLVEDRGESIDVGLEKLRKVASRGAPSATALVTSIAEELSNSGNEDDIAMLAIGFRT